MLDKINYQIYRAKYRWGNKLPLRVPVDVSLELSSRCNMACSYCYHSASTPFTQGIMKWETAKLILDDCGQYGVNSIKTNYRGESTLNINFEKITSHAKMLRHRYGGTTLIDRVTNSNFKFMHTREAIFRGLANQTKVKVSYDSFDKKVFETQRNKGLHDVTTKNIDTFYNHPARIKSETRLVIQAVRTKLNLHEDIEGNSKKRWPDATISIRDVVEGRVENDEIEELKHKERDVSDRKPCQQAFVRLMCNWDGKVQVCCPDISSKLIVGDIYKNNLKEIFNSDKAKMIRKKLNDKTAFNEFPACKGCSSFESYKNYQPVWDS